VGVASLNQKALVQARAMGHFRSCLFRSDIAECVPYIEGVSE